MMECKFRTLLVSTAKEESQVILLTLHLEGIYCEYAADPMAAFESIRNHSLDSIVLDLDIKDLPIDAFVLGAYHTWGVTKKSIVLLSSDSTIRSQYKNETYASVLPVSTSRGELVAAVLRACRHPHAVIDPARKQKTASDKTPPK